MKTAEETEEFAQAAKYYYDTILPDMEEIRAVADAAEEYLPDSVLPYPRISILPLGIFSPTIHAIFVVPMSKPTI